MIRQIVISIIVLMAMASAALAGGTRTLFGTALGRPEPVLRADAELMGSRIQNAKRGDYIGSLMPNLKQMFSFRPTERNPVTLRKLQQQSLHSVGSWYQDSATRKPGKLDIAGQLRIALDRFNADGQKDSYWLVMLSSGIHNDGKISFEGKYPSDSWINGNKVNSIFSAVPRNTTGKPVMVLFITEKGAFVNRGHEARIERFYRILLHSRGCRLVYFGPDHQAAYQNMIRPRKSEQSVPEPQDINGELRLYEVDEEPVGKVEKAPKSPVVVKKATSVKVVQKKAPAAQVAKITESKPLSGSVLSTKVDNGTASIWVGLAGPNRSLSSIKPQDLRVTEKVKRKTREIPPNQVTIEPNHPVVTLIARDCSHSIGKNDMEFCMRAIWDFINSMRSGDKAALLNFTDRIYIMQRVTSDKSKLLTALKKEPQRGGTAFYTALFSGLDILQHENSRRRFLLAYTDGVDGDSAIKPKDVIKFSKRTSIPLILIGIGGVDDKTLGMLADKSGGIYIKATETKQLREVYKKVSEALTNSIVLQYPTSAQNSDEVDVDVRWR